ncbi:hypothetical protein ABMA27_011143 [Loxostege sticticalis]|uniref:Polypeptide N-acetylgalactosaminyltransferase n=1 Tax=Loxostege sticticalis TaxID=481309 RepID=A0ABR3H3U4_LOXSC
MVARVTGAKAARGDVLIFLDAHCEVGHDWLRPLLQRIRHKRDAVLTPLIDVIDQSTFSLEASENFQVGGFTFMGHFTWIEVPEREKKRRGSDIAPTWSPTMAGGLFAINRAYYWELGAYDEQMAGWGGENLEMSFRIWQCGGTLETIPCSRVGHVFRSFHPYGLPAHTDTHGINTARMAEVWMDEYAELFYLHRPDLRKNPKIGDVTHRKILREKLKCKSFQWYLDNVYKEKFVPVRDVYGYGRFSNPATNMCLDTLQREVANSPLGVYPCHQGLQATQYFSLSSQGQLRDEESCAELQHNRDEAIERGRRVLMAHCHGKRGQKWRYLPSGQLQHMETGLCLDAGLEAGADVMAKPCRSDEPAQRWRIDYNQDNDFKLSNDAEPSEQEERLSKLRRQRRISRSLLSFTEEPPSEAADANATVRRHTHKKRRGRKHAKKRSRRKHTKNKFILRLVRRLANNSEEHLEVDIHCKHKKLYPNNSFVRDLVTVLNEKDIKVINNGRVFERNRVTDLNKDHHDRNEQKVLNKMDIVEPTVEPLATLAPLAPLVKIKQPKHLRNKKRKHEPMEPLSFNSLASFFDPPAAPAEAAEPTDPPASEPASRKIIIEDFVQITPTTSQPNEDGVKEVRAQKSRKRKRTRTHTTQPTTEAVLSFPSELSEQGVNEPPEDDDKDALLKLLSKKRLKDRKDEERLQKAYSDEEPLKVDPPSAEDAPMLSSAEPVHKRDGDMRDNALERDTNHISEEDWAIGESRFRVTNDSAARRSAKRREHRHRTERHRPTTAALPVKVVMRSNLTFNLGDEFFAWRRRPDSVADLLGELAIPSNSSHHTPPIHAWIMPETRAKHEGKIYI